MLQHLIILSIILTVLYFIFSKLYIVIYPYYILKETIVDYNNGNRNSLKMDKSKTFILDGEEKILVGIELDINDEAIDKIKVYKSMGFNLFEIKVKWNKANSEYLKELEKCLEFIKISKVCCILNFLDKDSLPRTIQVEESSWSTFFDNYREFYKLLLISIPTYLNQLFNLIRHDKEYPIVALSFIWPSEHYSLMGIESVFINGLIFMARNYKLNLPIISSDQLNIISQRKLDIRYQLKTPFITVDKEEGYDANEVIKEMDDLIFDSGIKMVKIKLQLINDNNYLKIILETCIAQGIFTVIFEEPKQEIDSIFYTSNSLLKLKDSIYFTQYFNKELIKSEIDDNPFTTINETDIISYQRNYSEMEFTFFRNFHEHEINNFDVQLNLDNELHQLEGHEPFFMSAQLMHKDSAICLGSYKTQNGLTLKYSSIMIHHKFAFNDNELWICKQSDNLFAGEMAFSNTINSFGTIGCDIRLEDNGNVSLIAFDHGIGWVALYEKDKNKLLYIIFLDNRALLNLFPIVKDNQNIGLISGNVDVNDRNNRVCSIYDESALLILPHKQYLSPNGFKESVRFETGFVYETPLNTNSQKFDKIQLTNSKIATFDYTLFNNASKSDILKLNQNDHIIKAQCTINDVQPYPPLKVILKFKTKNDGFNVYFNNQFVKVSGINNQYEVDLTLYINYNVDKTIGNNQLFISLTNNELYSFDLNGLDNYNIDYFYLNDDIIQLPTLSNFHNIENNELADYIKQQSSPLHYSCEFHFDLDYDLVPLLFKLNNQAAFKLFINNELITKSNHLNQVTIFKKLNKVNKIDLVLLCWDNNLKVQLDYIFVDLASGSLLEPSFGGKPLAYNKLELRL